jgi:integrase
LKPHTPKSMFPLLLSNTQPSKQEEGYFSPQPWFSIRLRLPVKERSYYRYEDGKRVKHTVTPVLGEKAAHNGKVVYSLDFEVTPHQLRHTYITNLIHASVDPKTVQYLAGHESSKITMDIYAKVKYNRPDELVRSMSCAFASWDAAQ